MKRTALITGATSGIGEATARLLSENDYNLIICGRREDRLENIKSELSSSCELYTLTFDVRDKKDVFEKLGSLPERWKSIDVLINNAGNAHGLDPIQNGKLDDWDAMMDINVKGLLYVSKTVIPGMIEKGKGHIINIGSIAGKEVYPNGNVYCASKFAVDAISQGMRIDLNQHGIKVSQINPGLVNTEFSLVRFKGDADRADNIYKGIQPLSGHDVAEFILFILTRPSHVNIADSIIFPTAQASATILKRD